MNPEERQVENLKELRATFTAQKAALEALAREAQAQGLPTDAPPSLEQVESATPPDIFGEVRGAAFEAASVLAELSAPAARPKTKTPRKMRDTI